LVKNLKGLSSFPPITRSNSCTVEDSLRNISMALTELKGCIRLPEHIQKLTAKEIYNSEDNMYYFLAFLKEVITQENRSVLHESTAKFASHQEIAEEGYDLPLALNERQRLLRSNLKVKENVDVPLMTLQAEELNDENVTANKRLDITPIKESPHDTKKRLFAKEIKNNSTAKNKNLLSNRSKCYPSESQCNRKPSRRNSHKSNPIQGDISQYILSGTPITHSSFCSCPISTAPVTSLDPFNTKVNASIRVMTRQNSMRRNTVTVTSMKTQNEKPPLIPKHTVNLETRHKLLAWLEDIQLIKPGSTTIAEFPGYCRNGVLLSDLILRLEGVSIGNNTIEKIRI